MNSTSLNTFSSAKTKSRKIDLMSKGMILKLLSKLPDGELTIMDGEQQVHFGKAAADGLKGCIEVVHPAFFGSLLLGGSMGAAESYMRGEWRSPNLTQVIQVLARNINWLNNLDGSRLPIKKISNKLYHWLNRNTETGSKKNIAAHYDLSNEFFQLFLDKSMMYSAAVFDTTTENLEQAALNKLELICQDLQLKPTDHLLEIGTGWGGLAIYAAQHYGCRVTTTTISKEQFNMAQERVKAAGLEDRVTLLLEDYRLLEGQYDKLVSIEMIEAVGHAFYDTYFKRCSELLKSNGLMSIQAITIPDHRFSSAQQSVDFIQRYIFPGGSLPSHNAISDCLARVTDMQTINMREIGLSYAETLQQWRLRFHQELEQVKRLGFNDTFIRMWDFYLCYCEGGFRERAIGTAQYVFAKPGWREPKRANA